MNELEAFDNAIIAAASSGPVRHRKLTVGPVRKACENLRDVMSEEKTYLQVLDNRLRALRRDGYIKHVGGGWVLGEKRKVPSNEVADLIQV